MTSEKGDRAVRPDRPATTDPKRARKTDRGLVVLDNPDDGEIYDTGDASDFAGERQKDAREPATRDESSRRR